MTIKTELRTNISGYEQKQKKLQTKKICEWKRKTETFQQNKRLHDKSKNKTALKTNKKLTLRIKK